MALEIGSIVEGRVTGIAKFGAFVELPERKMGLVHISEISASYVSDINDFLKVHDTVKVKVISIDEKGKIALSMKQAGEGAQDKRPEREPHGEKKSFLREGNQQEHHGFARRETEAHGQRDFRPQKKREMTGSFEDKLSRFLKDSDERLLDLKRNTESKRGGRGSRRSD